MLPAQATWARVDVGQPSLAAARPESRGVRLAQVCPAMPPAAIRHRTRSCAWR